MPGEWLPWTDKGYLDSVYRRAAELGVGVGGPDLLPYRKGQMNHSYPRLRNAAGKIPTSIAVQDGNYEYVNPKTGKRVTLAELLEFATGFLRVDYLFWAAQEPFYSRQVLPFLNENGSTSRVNQNENAAPTEAFTRSTYAGRSPRRSLPSKRMPKVGRIFQRTPPVTPAR